LPNLSLSAEEPEPEDATILSQQSEQVQELLNQLSPEYRAAVVLRYWYDYSYSEIADILDTTESAIKSRLFRARQVLADKLNPAAASGAMTPLLENA
ncbi:MAG TPA: RNA polymerase sigma factor, partial [Oceanobacillus sp.]|nr:RNA polymerase sigma factor [Oceanobacillus sp.]